MSIIQINKQNIFTGIKKEIFCKNIETQSQFDKIQLKHNLVSYVKDIIVSENELYLAILTSDKLVEIFQKSANSFISYKTYQLTRAASKICFSKDSKFLLVADKTGDVFIYNIKESEEGKKILGHLSLLTDILMTPDGKFIITCDRDEKIRVTNYPKTYNIQSFCLGHKEFITSISLLPHNENYLLSTSGDGTAKIWNYLSGKELTSLNVNNFIDDKNLIVNYQKIMKEEDIEATCLPISYASCCFKNDNCSLLAISMHMYNTLLVFEISSNLQSFSFNLVDKILLNDQLIGVSITSTDVWILTSGDALNLQQWSLESKYILKNSEELGSKIDTGEKDEVRLLYKRKFDNLHEYQVKKKQRLGIN